MNVKVLFGVFAVINGVRAERNIANHKIESVIRERGRFKAFDLDIGVRVKFLCNLSRNRIQFHTEEPCAVGNLFWHKTEEIACSHCRFQNAVVSFDAHLRECFINAFNHFFRGEMGVQNAPSCFLVIFGIKCVFQLPILFLPVRVVFVKRLCKSSPADILCQCELFTLGWQSSFFFKLIDQSDGFKVCLKSRLCAAEFALIEPDPIEVGVLCYLRLCWHIRRFFRRSLLFREILLVLLLFCGSQVFAVVDQVCNSGCDFVPVQDEIRVGFRMILVVILAGNAFPVVVKTDGSVIHTAYAVFVFQKSGKIVDRRILFVVIYNPKLTIRKETPFLQNFLDKLFSRILWQFVTIFIEVIKERQLRLFFPLAFPNGLFFPLWL